MKVISITCSLLLSLFIYTCGYQMASEKDRLQASGRYGDLEKHLEADGTPLGNMQTQRLFPLCLSYSKLKRYNKLFPCVEKLEEKIGEGDKYDIAGPKGFEVKSDITPIPYLLRAEAYLELGDYKRATEYAEKANAPFPKANSLGYYSEFAIRKGALTILVLAQLFSKNIDGAERYRMDLEGLDLGGFVGIAVRAQEKRKALAKVYMALGEYEKALENLKSGVFDGLAGLTDFVIGASAEEKSIWTYLELPKKYMFNKCLLETGKIEKAKAGYDALLNIPQTRDNGDIYWLILFDRGRIAQREGKQMKAIDFYGQAVEVIEKQRATIHTEVNKIGFIGDKQKVYNHIVELLFTQTRYAEAFGYSERAKARALVDMLASRKQFIMADTSIQKAGDLVGKLYAAEFEAKVQDESIATEQFDRQRAVVVEIKEEIRNTDPELASLVVVSPPDVAEIQHLLPSDETLVEYFGSGDTLFAFIVNQDGVRGMKLEVKGLRQRIEVFRDHIMASGSYQFKADGQALYEKLIQPIEGMIGSKNLTIVPHGVLHYLPFNALYSDNGFMIDRYSIRVLPSASVMRFLKDRREGHAGNLLAFGNPDLGDPTYDLPGAQNEAIAITKDQPRSKLLLRNQATETAVKQYGAGFRYLHFATHGTFDAEKPLSSGLLMAGDSENDGTLTVGELYDLRLPADLVTLSACETALGKVANGDDVVGFTRGFLYAGTSSIVSSLWKVDDQATSILMQKFYESLKESDKRSALRTAQLKVKDTYNPHPYFWAAFQITGSVQ